MSLHTNLTLRRAAVPAGPAAAAARLLTALRRWYRRHCDLRHLRGLDDHLLRDVGLTRDQVARAVREPGWRL
ncbi:MAG: DUF1127 domain-containing protein [Kiloniellaceae bacterium]